MPLVEKSAEEMAAGVAAMQADLLQELRRHGVGENTIGVLGHFKFDSIKKFQCFGTSEDNVRESCGLLGLKATAIEELSEIASITATWNALKAYQAVEDKTRADNKMLGLPNKLRPSEYATVRQQYERSLGGKVEDVRLPGAPIIEWLEKEVEEGEFVAPRLSELPSRKEVMEAAANIGKQDTLGLAVTITATGNRISVPSRVKVPMPANPEELRERIGLLAAGVEFFKIKQPEIKAYQKVNEATWTAHLNYILGPKVRGKQVSDNEGNIVKTPAWPLIINYEQAIRARAAELMNEGHSDNDFHPMRMEIALKVAREDQELRTEVFLERLHLQQDGSERRRKGGKKGEPGSSNDHEVGRKGGGKGKGGRTPPVKKPVKEKGGGKKGAGKGRGAGANKRLQTSHNGKPICFAFNNKGEGCKDGKNCARSHVCQMCQGDHPLHECPGA